MKKIVETNKIFFPHYIAAIIIIILGFLAYHNSLKNVFLFDDKQLIIDNFLIKDFSHIKDIFTTQLFHASGENSNFYRPIQSLFLMVNYKIWGLKPFGYHLSNILIHIFNAVIIYFLILSISKKQTIALTTSFLFCVHTVLSGAVNYIAASSDLLSALFFLLALLAYVVYRTKRHSLILLVSSSLFFIFALLSKEAAIILPLILLLYIHSFCEKRDKYKNNIWVYFIIAAIYILLRLTVLNFKEGGMADTSTGYFPLHIRLFTMAKVLMIYIRLLIFPIGLHMEWSITPATSFVQDEVFLSAVALLIIGIFIRVLFSTSRLKFFAIMWFFIALIPYANIYPIAYFLGQDYLYIPSVGIFMLVAIYLFESVKKSVFYKCVGIGMLSLAMIFYSILTIKRAEIWADPVKLYTEVLRYSPDNVKARINLGAVLEKKGLHAEAIDLYKEAAKIDPNRTRTITNLVSLYYNKGMYNEALEELKKAVAINPKDFVSYNDIGLCYKKKGDIEKALEAYKKALTINPNYPITYNNIGNIQRELSQIDGAIISYKKAIDLNPDNAIFYGNLAMAYKDKKMFEEARKYFEKVLELEPYNKEALGGLNSIK